MEGIAYASLGLALGLIAAAIVELSNAVRLLSQEVLRRDHRS